MSLDGNRHRHASFGAVSENYPEGESCGSRGTHLAAVLPGHRCAIQVDRVDVVHTPTQDSTAARIQLRAVSPKEDRSRRGRHSRGGQSALSTGQVVNVNGP